jgi:N-acetylmuramoyl-L-alanine amidase
MPLTELRKDHSQPGLGRAISPILYIAFINMLFLSSAEAKPQQSPVPAPPVAPRAPDLPPLPAPPMSQFAVQPAFPVVIDAAHGGANSGARFAANSLEKDITLELSTRLRAALINRGMTVVMTRESDSDIANNQRAGIANHALASACLIIHATAAGSGVHLFTSSLAAAAATASVASAPGPIPWQTAQAAWVTRSLRLSSEINSALGQANIPTTLGLASVQPLDNLSCPAVAIEVAPLAASTANRALPISDGKYRQRIIDALAAAMIEWRTDWKQQP